MSTDTNKTLVRSFFKAFEANDQSTLKEIFAPDLVAYSHNNPEPQSRSEILQGISMWTEAFSDIQFTIKDLIAEGDKVAAHTIVQATHNGNFQGQPPTGKLIEVEGYSLDKIKNGKIVEHTSMANQIGLMEQLGIIPQQSRR